MQNFLEGCKKINFLKQKDRCLKKSVIGDKNVVRKYTNIVHLLALKKLKNKLCVRSKYIWN